jgi:hypothetical protein
VQTKAKAFTVEAAGTIPAFAAGTLAAQGGLSDGELLAARAFSAGQDLGGS